MPATRTGAVTALLATADAILAENFDGGGPLTPAGRVRGAAYALRIALEAAVDATLAAEEAGLGTISMRAKLLCLRHYAGPALAHRVNALWNRLSEACKYHHDEMGPRHAQVHTWRAAVGTLVAELGAAKVVVASPQQAGT
ncbi:hypothetical protein HTV45_25125 [Streptomyces sp. CHD11]|uniref:hypothetical protein n=1 Tax=Streptomyces sp. CHD11 TaxID=2741325 RepID=UPI001BFC2FDD|nr:hypothetical protein [Streptomyces sp. CHD11]MBT3154112.1 hypothetical protein [Streptomyces sp. CHD11]